MQGFSDQNSKSAGEQSASFLSDSHIQTQDNSATQNNVLVLSVVPSVSHSSAELTHCARSAFTEEQRSGAAIAEVKEFQRDPVVADAALQLL